MIDRHLAILLLGVALIMGFAVAARARVDPDSEYLRQLRREGHSEFCRNVGRPSQRLAAAIKSALQEDPTWATEASWLRRIVEQYQRAGCGET